MSADSSFRFTYSVQDINQTVRSTNVFIRSLNSIRLTIRDFQQVAKEPTLANIMWTLVQLSRTFNTLKRLMRLIVAESNQARSLMGWMERIVYLEPPDAPTTTPGVSFSDAFRSFAVTTEANINGNPVPISALDISDITERSATVIQGVLENEATYIVDDAKMLLLERIMYPEKSTGNLEGSIGWYPDFPGVRIYAGAPYGFWVEEGQRSFTGHHFLRDAALNSKPYLAMKIKAELDALIFHET